jgi:hypothetical protein
MLTWVCLSVLVLRKLKRGADYPNNLSVIGAAGAV